MKKKLLSPILFAILALVIVGIFLLPIGSKEGGGAVNVPLHKYVRMDPVDGSYNRSSPSPTQTAVTVEPKIDGNKLVTPKISKLSIPKTITLIINNNWEYKDYSFTYCQFEEAVCQFHLNIIYKLDPKYEISIYDIDTDFGNCSFNGENAESPYTILLDEYQEVNTNFGVLKIGKKKNLNTFVVCQKGVKSVISNNSGWVALTDLGFVDIHNPNDYDPAIIGQMISIIANTTIQKAN